MSEQPNTAEIRYRLERGGATYIGKDTLALCDALDAARAEAAEAEVSRLRATTGEMEECRGAHDEMIRVKREWQYRAEAAEARVVELDLFVGIMRDRVATVLAMHVRTIDPWDCDSCELLWPCPTVQALLP